MQENIKKYWQYGVILILILLLFFKCNSYNTDTIVLKQLNKELENKKAKTKIVIKNHYDTITKIETKIKEREKIVYVKIDSIKSLNTKGITNYYRERYNVSNEVKSTNIGVALQDSVAILNITELIKFDNCVEVVKSKDIIIENHLFIESQQDTIIDIVENQKKLVDAQNKELTTAIKKERRKTTFYQIALAVVTILAGAELFAK